MIKMVITIGNIWFDFDEVLLQDYGKFKLESQGGVYGTKKNRYYFDRVQSDS